MPEKPADAISEILSPTTALAWYCSNPHKPEILDPPLAMFEVCGQEHKTNHCLRVLPVE